MKQLLFILFISIVKIIPAQEQIHFYEDTAQMKKEILSRIPIGTPIDSAKKIMIQNKFEYNDDYKNETFMYRRKEDFLLLFHDEGVIFSMNRWKVALVYKEKKLADVEVQFVIIGL